MVGAKDPGQDVALDHITGCGRATGEIAHDLRIAVKIDQTVYISLREAP